MTLFWHHPCLIAVLLGHQSHVQSIFHGYQSECMNKMTKQTLRHSNLDAEKKCCLLESKWKIKYDLLHSNLDGSPFIYHPSCINSLKICPNHAQIWFKLVRLMESSVTPFTNCTKSLDNLISKSSEQNDIHMTGMAICECSVLISGWRSVIKFT